MEYRRFGDKYVLRVDKGEEVLESITKLCRLEDIKLGYAVGLGATDHIVVGLFDTKAKVYKKTEIMGPMEITSLVGDISTMNGETYLHFHINVCDENMNVRGGHMNACYISATGEITVIKIDGTVEREPSEEIGLNLYKFI